MRPLSVSALCCLAAASLCGAQMASAGPIYNCQGTATVYDPVANVVVTSGGNVACLVYDDATVSLGGQLNAAAPLGSGNITSTTYDSAGRLVSDTGSFATSTTYDSGALTTDTNPLGTERYFYDSQGRLATETGPASITQTVYDASSRLTSLTDAQGTTTFKYDAQGRLTETDLGSLKTFFAYDALGRLMTETTPTDVTTYTYDALGRVTGAVDMMGSTQIFSIIFSYDPGTGLLDQVNTNGFITTYTYSNGLLSGASDPGTTSLIYTGAPVPEPSSLVMLGSALLGLLSAVRWRRKGQTS